MYEHPPELFSPNDWDEPEPARGPGSQEKKRGKHEQIGERWG